MRKKSWQIEIKVTIWQQKFNLRSVCIMQTDRTLEERLSGATKEEQVEREVIEIIKGECRQVKWE